MRVRRRISNLFARVTGAVIVAVLLAAAPAGAQEKDNPIFSYSRLETDAARAPGAVGVWSWDATGWIGTDNDRLWWRTFGERSRGAFTEAEAQLLYGRYVRTFWDVVVGYRQELRPTETAFLTGGIQGLAPYWFDISLLGYLSQRGKVGVRFEIETDWFLTQRLILRPGARFDWDATADPRRERPAGFNYREVGLRMRYEIRRKFAPYVDVSYIGESGTLETGARGFRFGAGLWLIP